MNALAVPPAFPISAATRSAASSLMSDKTTFTPLAASALPMASPSPEPPPVTIATLPANPAMEPPSGYTLSGRHGPTSWNGAGAVIVRPQQRKPLPSVDRFQIRQNLLAMRLEERR